MISLKFANTRKFVVRAVSVNTMTTKNYVRFATKSEPISGLARPQNPTEWSAIFATNPAHQNVELPDRSCRELTSGWAVGS
jgi:hypothetical protein